MDLQVVFSCKVTIVALILMTGSIMDLKSRRVSDRIWMLMLISCMPLLAWEMWLKGADESPVSLLSLLLPIGGMLFVLFGYPEPKEAMKGSLTDIAFILLFAFCIIGSGVSFLKGDLDLTGPIGISSIFMLVYFTLYHIPIGGTRIIHGGADAKCLMSLAAIFPWYISELPYTIGPFYEILTEHSMLGWIFPIHLSVLFNGAVLTTLVLFIVLPVINILRKDLRFPRMFTSYKMDVRGISGKHVWVILEHTARKKVDPTAKLEERLKEKGEIRVWVTPKIPFILSLWLGFLVQIVIGNLVAMIFLMI